MSRMRRSCRNNGDPTCEEASETGGRSINGKESLPLFLGTKKPADVAGCQEKLEIFGEKSGMDGVLQGRHSAILQ